MSSVCTFIAVDSRLIDACFLAGPRPSIAHCSAGKRYSTTDGDRSCSWLGGTGFLAHPEAIAWNLVPKSLEEQLTNPEAPRSLHSVDLQPNPTCQEIRLRQDNHHEAPAIRSFRLFDSLLEVFAGLLLPVQIDPQVVCIYHIF